MLQEKNLCWKLGSLLLVLVMLMSLMVACGGDDDDDDETTIPTGTESVDAEPAQNTEPVKIGATLPFTGGLSIAGALASESIDVVKGQVKARGGIQVGDVRRPLEVVTFDDKGEVSGTIAGWSKLVKGENVSAIFGGASGAQMELGAEQSTEYKVPFITYTGSPGDLTDYPYTSRIGYNELKTADPMIKLIDDLQPQTVALLGDEESADHLFFDYLKETVLSPRGIDVIYEQYIPLGTQDMAPYLTSIRGEEPDLLIHFAAAMGTALATFREIVNQGGWGDITYLAARSPQSSFMTMKGAEGTYMYMVWSPLMDNPGTREFLDAWEKYGPGTEINPIHVYFYDALWTAIHAVELAGSDDPEDVNNALRSGNLSWEAPIGLITIGTDGENDYAGILVLVGKDGEHTIAYE